MGAPLRFACLSSLVVAWAAPALAQIDVTIDPTQDAHAISPLIYGMNFPDGATFDAARVPLARWGGNSTSRYNYEIDVSNTGNDYFFENIPGCWSGADNYCSNPPADPKAQSGANAFLSLSQTKGATSLFTVSTLGWVAKPPPVYAHPFPCGCPKTALASQDSFDPYDTNCGNCQSGGNWLAAPDPSTTTSVAVDASWTTAWVQYLVNGFGPSKGRIIYALDNEPNLWSSTHHDVHPARLTYDELWQRMRDNAAAIVAADPTAEISGPAEWGWPNYFCSDADDVSQGCSPQSPDRAAHGGEELMAWLLDQAHAYEQQNGVRILHYLDLHYYPQGGNPPEITRSLWDPTYTDPSWINDTIRLIPRMHDWVDQHYPGTRLAVSEYDFYHHDEPVGAVTYAEVLGIFAREGLDAATAWSPPAPTEKAFAAYVLYRNYDGAGAGFESTYVKTTVAGGSGVQAFGAVSATRATVVLINESGSAATVNVHLGAFQAGASAQWWDNTNGTIARGSDVTVSGDTATLTLAPTSIGMLVATGSGPAQPDFASVSDMRVPALGDGPFDDAAARGDAGSTSAQPGCGCRVGARSEAPSLVAFLVGVALVVAMRRRRRA